MRTLLIRHALLALNLGLLAACSNADFGGSGATASSPKTTTAAPGRASAAAVAAAPVASVPPAAPSAAAPAAPAPDAATPPAPATGTQDITKSGFQCPKDMTEAVGGWTGTYTGAAVGNLIPVKGTVAFDLATKTPTSLQVNKFGIAGGIFGGDQVQSILIDFQLNCGDLALHDAVVNYAGKQLAVSLAFTGETWNPPTLTGTWVAHLSPLSVVIANGTWSVAKK